MGCILVLAIARSRKRVLRAEGHLCGGDFGLEATLLKGIDVRLWNTRLLVMGQAYEIHFPEKGSEVCYPQHPCDGC